MSKKLYHISLVILLFFAQTNYSQSIDSIDVFIENEIEVRKTPGLSIAIIQNGKVIHKKAYGYSVVEHQVPANVHTIYPLASLTKQFIAMAILLLEQDDKIEIDVPINKYLDSLPQKWKSLTLNQLLSHTAGLAPMEEEWKSLKRDGWPKHVTRKMLWDSAKQDSILDKPGNQFRYHNVGYSLAVFLIEQITKNDHRSFFKKRIFEPLEMDNTFFEDQTKVTMNQAEGYTLKNGELAKIWRVGQEDIGVGDGIYSDIEDMIKWMKSINDNTLLKPKFQRKMYTQTRLNNGTSFRYGLGWWLPERNDISYYYHNGVTGTEILSIPKIKLDIIILSNLGQGEFDEVHYWGLAQEIAGKFFINEFQHRPTPTPLPNNFKDFIGTFEYESGGELEIYLKNNNIYLKDNYGEALMVYQGNNVFILKDEPVEFQFLSANRIQVIDEIWNDDFANRLKN
ncbi:serine hydrolase domain-containing protein [Flagellimonas allohymeniacidonis]|uniref:Class A beta-lactamase-related serine hydrolase n=1 Tax=Flagellimonas allohymeniacidonis TaxID=2517819 RepID=A0A4Q8QDN5_9FLAO|nr:serine hydrolase domain-containing protein [Allomuricauda hymeniacidonis]TAI47834.1 class A beta-lactamase-related serine hydrolase [Allomuricauda hymeniacidonis]